MKTYKNAHQIPVEVLNYVKLAGAISWVIYLHIAHAQQVFFEAFLLSVALAVTCCYFLTRKEQAAKNNQRSAPEKSISSEDYLNIFFCSSC